MDEVLREPCPTDWLLRGFLEAEGLAVLFGASGSMKSFLALDMGLCIASGLLWHGHAVPRPGPVIYVAGEGFRGLGKRLQAWLVDKGIDAQRVRFHVASEAVQFLDAGSLKAATTAIADLAEQHGPPRLVIVDTLARCFGGDENRTEDMGLFVTALDRLRAQFGCAVLVVHHSGLNEKDRARGASALRAALDWEYRLDAQDGVRRLTCTKSKDFDPPADLAFEPETVSTGWTDPETGYPVTSVVLRPADLPSKKEKPLTGAKRIALEALQALCEAEGRAHIDEWRAEAYRRGISSSSDPQAKKQAFRRAVPALLDSGHIETENDIYWPRVTKDTFGVHVPSCTPVMGGYNRVHTPLGVYLCTPDPESGEGDAA
jgi:hypothetical protein